MRSNALWVGVTLNPCVQTELHIDKTLPFPCWRFVVDREIFTLIEMMGVVAIMVIVIFSTWQKCVVVFSLTYTKISFSGG